MHIQVIIFGQLTDITGDSEIVLHGIKDTDSLVAALQAKYPAFADAKYAVAIERKVVIKNTVLSDGLTVALMPPFSGG